jgi:hypothetical protein
MLTLGKPHRSEQWLRRTVTPSFWEQVSTDKEGGQKQIQVLLLSGKRLCSPLPVRNGVSVSTDFFVSGKQKVQWLSLAVPPLGCDAHCSPGVSDSSTTLSHQHTAHGAETT